MANLIVEKLNGLAFLSSFYFYLIYFFLKPPSKAPTAGLAGVIPTFFSSGFALFAVDAAGALGS
jgi:hypothetical protein